MPNTHTTLTSLFEDIANAIREKSGESGTIIADNFPTAISNLSSTGTLSSIFIYQQPNNLIQEAGQNFDTTGMIVMANFLIDDEPFNNVIITNYTYPTTIIQNGINNITISYTFNGITETTTVSITGYTIGDTLNATSWATISYIAQQGIGDTYWNLGDCKEITLNGKIGDYFTANNLVMCVFILDFNHPFNKTEPDNNIIFGGFKTAVSNGELIAFLDSRWAVSGNKCFSMNHNSTYNYGGWPATDFRYDILGATDTQPNQYYSSSRSILAEGYNATMAAITNPLTDTLMAALPSEFRNVLRLHKHCVDTRGDENSLDPYVNIIIDAIFLLSEYEVFGSRSKANAYENYHQAQMGYFRVGNSTMYKGYTLNSIYSSTQALLSSSDSSGSNAFCSTYISSSGSVSSNTSYGLAPAFKV